MATQILRVCPRGTPVSDAMRLLERSGFDCVARSASSLNLPGMPDPRIDGRSGTFDYVFCHQSRSDRWMVTREWEVAVLQTGAQVDEVLAKVWLDGP